MTSTNPVEGEWLQRYSTPFFYGFSAMDSPDSSTPEAPRSWAVGNHDSWLLFSDFDDFLNQNTSKDVVDFGTSDGLPPYPSFPDISKTSDVPGETFIPKNDSLSPWESVPRQLGRRRTPSDNSASSCATFSSVSSHSPTRSLRAPDQIVEHLDQDSTSNHITSKRISNAPTSFQCTLCSKRFTRAYNLRAHMRTHTDELLFDQDSTSNHITSKRISNAPTSFQCTLCSKRFTRAYNLRAHLRTHTDERPFVCAICGKSFALQYQKRRHEGLHSASRFSCKGETQKHVTWGCGRVFTHLDIFARHLRSEVGQSCIKALVDEELPVTAEMEQDIYYTSIVEPYISEKRNDERAFPPSLLALYPGLATLPWSDSGQSDAGFDDEISGSTRSTVSNMSWASSCDTFSSLSSSEFSTESSSNHNDAIPQIKIVGNCNSNGDTVTSNTVSPSESSFELPHGELNLKEANHLHTTIGDAASMWVCEQNPLVEDFTAAPCHGPLNYQYSEDRIRRAQLIVQDAALDLCGSPSIPMYSAIAKETVERSNNKTEALECFSFVAEAAKIKGIKNEKSTFHGQWESDDQCKQLQPSTNPFAPVFSTVGKASPYSVQSQSSESDTFCDDEIGMSFDEYGSISSPSPSVVHISDLWEPKQMLIIEVLREFWNTYNKEYPHIISRCILSASNSITHGAMADGGSSSGPDFSASRSSSTATSSSISGAIGSKRKICGGDGRSDDDQGSIEPSQESAPVHGNQPLIRYACPFRKHNPRKYNMHHYQNCALGSFGSIARVKEHLYRRHMAPVQCVRCWLFFKDQEDLNVHLSASAICDRRDGEAAEGITPTMEKRLRSRKKTPAAQTDYDRWRDIYRMLFPGVIEEEIPSPFYEIVQDDAAQAPVSIVPVEEFMRQEVPLFFTSRLQNEIDNMNLAETGLLDDPTRLRETFIARMQSLISEAQDAAVEAYRQRLSTNSTQANLLMTPAPSLSSSGLMPTPSTGSSRTALDLYQDAFQTRDHPAADRWYQNLPSSNGLETNDALRDYLANQVPGEVPVGVLESGNGSDPPLGKDDVSYNFWQDPGDIDFSTTM